MTVVLVTVPFVVGSARHPRQKMADGPLVGALVSLLSLFFR